MNIIQTKYTKCVLNALFGVILSLAFISCDDFLSVDDHFSEMTQLDSIFQRKELVEKYIRGASSFLPNEGNLWTWAPNPFQGASDENFTSRNEDKHAAIKFLRDEITPFDNYYNRYPDYYQGIRMANVVLSRIHEVGDISDIDRRDYMGRCYFLRGYYALLLMLQYGPTPIVPDDPFSMDAHVESMALERGTYDECVAYICENMEKAHEYLPEKRDASNDMHVPDESVALAVMSRILLYQASPWYNGNPFYADWTRKSDGAHFISQIPDNSRWGKAAAAAKRFIIYNQDKQNRYALYTARKESTTPELPEGIPTAEFPQGAGGIDHYRSYSYIFNGEVPRLLNPEIIYSCAPNSFWDSPTWIATPANMMGSNGLNLTQDLIDAFYMVDGRSISNSSENYPYPASGEAHGAIGGGNLLFSGYTLPSSAARMYQNREMRFYATIGFSECFWPGLSYTASESNQKNVVVTYYADGNALASASNPDDYNHTGYTCKKYTHAEDHLKATVRSKIFPIFRYAEILLNYAEALNELDGTYTDEESGITVTGRDEAEILWAFNQIRFRAGLPGLTTLPERYEMQQLIKRERQIEFVCEGRRYHDLRRWGDAYEAYNKPVRGMNVKAKRSEREKFYTPTLLTNDMRAYRSFSYKHYFYPIPKSVINKNPKLVQNPGW